MELSNNDINRIKKITGLNDGIDIQKLLVVGKDAIKDDIDISEMFRLCRTAMREELSKQQKLLKTKNSKN